MASSVSKTRILVVGDDPAVRDSTCALLDALNYAATEAAGIAEALRVIQEHPPDLVVVDIYMPDGEGYALLRAFNARGIAIPAIACSSEDGTSGFNRFAAARTLGAVAVLEKPYSPDRLQEAIDAALVRPR